MPEPNSVALGRGAPTIYSEPMSSEPSKAEATMCVDPGATGAGGASSCPGAEELVRRYGGSEGAGPNLDHTPPPGDGSACADDALRAIGACAAALRRDPNGLLSCAGALGGYIECLATEDAANPGKKP